ncbi:pyrroline-5-carboxylate reductase [Sarocladium strictum]
MATSDKKTLCVLGTGNLGLAILQSIVDASPAFTTATETPGLPVSQYIACVGSEIGEHRVRAKLGTEVGNVTISRGDNVNVVRQSQVVILGVDPADVESVLSESGLADALRDKLLISVAAGWTRERLEEVICKSSSQGSSDDGQGGGDRNVCSVIRTLPNIAAMVGQSMTAIEQPDPSLLSHYLDITETIFNRIGKTLIVPARLMDAFTAVGGSTPAFFSVICDSLIDASVAVGMSWDMVRDMIVQAMKGSAEIMQSGGLTPAQLRDQGTSPEGCTIGGLMVLEEAGVRGHVGKALREAVTVARLMGKVPHVNDTR